MLRIHFSNRTEVLAQRLVESVASGEDVFAAHRVLVPHVAMQRWLSLAIAERHGICAQVEFGYLAPWLWQQVARHVPGAPAAAVPDPAVRTWRLHRLLGDAAAGPRPARLAAHLQAGDPLMRWDLARALAGLFDAYATYRPDWLARWQAGERVALPADDAGDQDWQAALWQAEPEASAQALLEALRARPTPAAVPDALPVHVFAPPTLAPLHRALMGELARFIDIELYLLNPCQEYWFDLTDPRRLAQLALQRRDAGHDVGHPLLAAWARQTQSQLGALIDGWPDAAIEEQHYEPHPDDHLLARLQNSMLQLTPVAPGDWVDLPERDRSLEVHCCHSLTRELEVLHDRLLGLFREQPTLKPSDVVVLLPDLDAAAPLIDAVFGTVPSERQIPFAISGRSGSRENPYARVLLELLALVESRLPASAVIGFMHQPQVAARFEWSDDHLERLQALLTAAGYRWGLDATHRSRLGLPGDERHTLLDAMERLFLARALPDRVDAPFAGVLPAAAGDVDAELLARLWCFVDRLQRLVEAWTGPQPPSAALASLDGAIADFLAPPEPGDDGGLAAWQALRQALRDMARAAQAGRAEAAPLALWRAALLQQLDVGAPGGVPTGRVTFTALTSLRGLPFAVIAVLGLNDADFPRRARPLEFDLMARQPRLGDRQRRDDDRNLFLDVVLAARQTLLLSYTGRSVRDNAELPPSVLVADLLDLLLPALAAPRHRLVVEHPLQPFSPEAFAPEGDPRRRSFDATLAEALRAAARRNAAEALVVSADAAPSGATEDAGGDGGDDDAGLEPALQPRLFAAALPAPGPEWREVALTQLNRFLQNPCRALLRRRLRLQLPEAGQTVDDDEPMLAGWPERRALAQRLLPPLLDDAPEAALRALAQAGVDMPGGAIGSAEIERELAQLRPFAARVRAALAPPTLPVHRGALAVTLDDEPWTVSADLPDLRATGLVRWVWQPMGPRVLLEAWLHHLWLAAAPAAGAAPTVHWVLTDGDLRFRPVAQPLPLLTTLLGLYRRGLCEPLRFFPKSAWAYVDSGGRLEKAAPKWASWNGESGERDDPAVALALRGDAVELDSAFTALAETVFAPVREHLQWEAA